MSLERQKEIPLKGKALESYLEFQADSQRQAANDWTAAKKRGFGSKVVMHPAVWLPGKGSHSGLASKGDKFERIQAAALEAEEKADQQLQQQYKDQLAANHLTSPNGRAGPQYHSASTAVSSQWAGSMPTDYTSSNARPKSRGVVTPQYVSREMEAARRKAATTLPTLPWKSTGWRSGKETALGRFADELFVPASYVAPMDRSGWNDNSAGNTMWGEKPGTLRDARGWEVKFHPKPEGWESAVPSQFSKSRMLIGAREGNPIAQPSHKQDPRKTSLDPYFLPTSNEFDFQPPMQKGEQKDALKRGEMLHRIEGVRRGGPARWFWTSPPSKFEKSWHTTV